MDCYQKKNAKLPVFDLPVSQICVKEWGSLSKLSV